MVSSNIFRYNILKGLIMSFLTNCFICLKSISVKNNSCDSSVNFNSCGKNSEISCKFSILVSRYLNLKSGYERPERTIFFGLCNTSRITSDKEPRLCETCLPVAESFCEMYDVWSCLQLEMTRCVQVIGARIQFSNANEEFENVPSQQNSTEIHQTTNLKTKTQQNFKKELLDQCRRKQKFFPRLTLSRVKVPASTFKTPVPATKFQSPELKQEKVEHEEGEDEKNEDADMFLSGWQDALSIELPPPGSVMDHAQSSESILIDIKHCGGFATSATIQVDKEKAFRDGFKRVHQEKLYLCSRFCKRRFSSIYRRNAHEKVCTNAGKKIASKSRQCLVCFKNFSCTSTLSRHMRIHNNYRPFKCLTCGKCFIQSSNLIDHRRVMHSTERPFKCRRKNCHKTFATSSKRTKHERQDAHDACIHTEKRNN